MHSIAPACLLPHRTKQKKTQNNTLTLSLPASTHYQVDHGQFHISLTPHVLSAVPMIEPEDRMQGSMQGLGIGRDAYNTMENDGMAVDDRFSSAADTTPTPVSPSPRSRVQGSGDCLAQDHNELFEDPAAHDLVVSAYIARWVSVLPCCTVACAKYIGSIAEASLWGCMQWWFAFGCCAVLQLFCLQ